MDAQTTVLAVLKFAGISLSSIFGLLGLLTSFRNPQTGQVTVWGRVALVGIVLSGLVAASSQALEMRRAAEAELAQAQQTNKQLHEIRRALDPIGEELMVTYVIEIDLTHPAFAAYAARLRADLEDRQRNAPDPNLPRAAENIEFSYYSDRRTILSAVFRSDSALSPRRHVDAERHAALFLNAPRLTLVANRQATPIDANYSDGDFFFYTQPGPAEARFVYSVREPNMMRVFVTSGPYGPSLISNGAFASYLDFEGAQLAVGLLRPFDPNGQRSDGAWKLTRAALVLPRGRTIEAPMDEIAALEEEVFLWGLVPIGVTSGAAVAD